MRANAVDHRKAPGKPQPNTSGKPEALKTAALARTRSADWLVIAALILLNFIPITAGAFRLTQLTS